MVYPIGMSVNYRLTRDLIQNLMDNVSMTPDIADRLVMTQELDANWRRLIVPARDAAAYEARQRYASADLAALTGYSDWQLAYWTNRHRARTGAPALGRRDRVDLSRAIDLSHRPVVSE